ncbi:outer membrane beta-barrel protein [Galbibacter pacificus]|uniref:Outer membrane beta-barrel protein n=1 Tax=Galbibacter pacificus TaxID=2996052 RepID=A0ABT6FUL7_9FLAO|nr:outer membrane beta-barrel protein [Galbibacter pacificus]MDG3583311.1 outer membrane beta-barrel protein [Galbibacter pacificus]MDG3586792.1 outer membrane beta-barrel protein [Galbibacter pacificus]
MNDKKNIERLFQEKFKDFEAAPPSHVWNDIQASLDKKDKKRGIVPIWWKLGGAAAATLALFFILNGLFWSNPEETFPEGNTITHTNDSIDNGNTATQDNASAKDETSDAVAETENEDLKNSEESHQDNSKIIRSSSYKTPQNGIANNETVDKNKTSGHDGKLNAPSEGTKKSNSPEIAQNNIPVNDAQKAIPNDNTIFKNNNNIAVTNNDEAAEKEKDIDSTITKKSLLDYVDEMEKEKEEETLASTSEKPARWSVNPNVAPIYYNSLSKGSPINTDFAGNSKTGDVNMSYGINIAYNVSKRLSVRSGINSVNMGYTTNNVSFGPSVFSAEKSTSNITFKNSATALNVSDQKTPSANFNDEIQARDEVVSSGSMDQKFGYLEIPMELKYRLVDKRFGVNIIGGVSSLFLTDNEVSFETNNMATEVGEANNLNDLSFSTNIGVGVDFQVTNKLLFNLEPMFKYQLNTFSREDGGFSPYLLGVYTGLSFQF